MFKGKVTIIKNVNGKEERIEKEFNSPEEYAKFVSQSGGLEPRLTLSEWSDFGSFIDSIFHNRLNEFLGGGSVSTGQGQNFLPVDLEKYDEEAAKIEAEKEKKEAKKKNIKDAITRLKGYIKTFEKEGKKDLAKSAKEDIKKLEEELKKLK